MVLRKRTAIKSVYSYISIWQVDIWWLAMSAEKMLKISAILFEYGNACPVIEYRTGLAYWTDKIKPAGWAGWYGAGDAAEARRAQATGRVSVRA
ncbi:MULTISPECIES: hypothetical protein [Aeromonas]|uniref:hypothetical protein n=1 Tax=Aeromonas TaxID=642 RepID=UPI0034A3325B